MINLGIVKPGSTILIPFHTFDSNDPSASVTITGLALADIGIYKGTSMTERASTTGVVLLDTDGIDIDTTTGIHGLSIDLSSNATADFYNVGSNYYVTVASITVDAATVNFVAATFTIGYPGAIQETNIATLASQTSFTLDEGSADNDAYIGCPVYVHDIASAVQVAFGYVSDYVGSTKTVTLAADPGIFTMAAGDNISFFPPSNVQAVAGTTQTAGDLVALSTTIDTVVDGIQSDLSNGTDGLGAIKAETALIVADTNELQTDDVPTLISNLDAVVDTVKAETALIVADTNELQTDNVPGLIATAQADLDIITDTDGVVLGAAGVNLIWDEVNTVGQHNTANSTGKQLREGTAALVISSGDCPTSGSHTTTAVVLKASENASDDVYNHKRITFTAGTNIGFSSIISDYDGTTKICTVTPALPAACDNTTDYEIVDAIVHAQTQGGGYAGGVVYVDASGSTTAQLYVDGTIDNPIDDGSWANAVTVADALNLRSFFLNPGASITLAATINNRLICGHGGTIALGGQDIDECHIFNSSVSGIATAAGEMEFHECEIGTASLQLAHAYDCTFDGTVTMTLAGNYNYMNCQSGVAGASSPTFTKTAGQAITAQWRRWSGGITVSGLESGDTLTISGELGTVTLNGADATVEIRGTYKGLTNNLTGSPTVNIDGAVLGADVASILVDTGTTIPGTISTAQADLDIITGADGVTLLSGTQASIDAIETDTGTDIPATLATIDGIVDAILLDTGTTLDTKLNDMQGATFNGATDSLEAIRDRGDAAWVTGAGGSAPTTLQNTTIATLASQVSFTLTAGSADNDAYNGMLVVVEDSATATQKAVGVVSDYAGSTKTITLREDPAIFTMAVGDTIDIIAISPDILNILADTSELQADNIPGLIGTAQADLDTITGADGVNLLSGTQASIDAIEVDTGTTLDGKIDTIDTVVDGIQTDLSNGTDGLGAIKTDTAAILIDTGTTLDGKINTIDSNVDAVLVDTGTTLPSSIAALDTVVDRIEVDTQDIQGRIPTSLSSGNMKSDLLAISTSTDAADNLEKSALQIIPGAAEGVPTTEVIQTNLAETQDDIYIGRTIIFTSGAAKDEATDITDYTGATGTVTVTALSNAPAATDTFIII